MLVDDFAQPAPRHVRIHLRGGDVGVPQHDLDAAQVRAAFHQMRGETVPDHVRRQIAKNPSLSSIALAADSRTPGGSSPSLAPSRTDTGSPGPSAAPDGPRSDTGRWQPSRRFPERHQALLVALAGHPQNARIAFHGRQLQAAQFGDPQARWHTAARASPDPATRSAWRPPAPPAAARSPPDSDTSAESTTAGAGSEIRSGPVRSPPPGPESYKSCAGS